AAHHGRTGILAQREISTMVEPGGSSGTPSLERAAPSTASMAAGISDAPRVGLATLVDAVLLPVLGTGPVVGLLGDTVGNLVEDSVVGHDHSSCSNCGPPRAG